MSFFKKTLMFKFKPFKHLPQIPNTAKLASKIFLGVFLITFLLDYQPTLGFPPVKQNIVRADEQTQTQQLTTAVLPVKFQFPHPIQMISTYFSWWHPGVDLAAPLGTPIHPVAEGTVESTGYDIWGLGETVSVDHPGGYQSLYAHLGKIYVKKGDQVNDDTILGEVGLTGHTSGPHTHLQISKDGKNFDPLTVLPKIN